MSPISLTLLFALASFVSRVRAPLVLQEQSNLFPAAAEDLRVPGDDEDGDWTLLTVVEAYGRLTGQSVHADGNTRARLLATHTGLSAGTVVPVERVQSFFEHLLVRNGFYLELLNEEEGARLVSIVSRDHSSRSPLSAARFVPAEELGVWASHPAVFIKTTIELEYADARALTNTMRILAPDSRTQVATTAGLTPTMILSGLAPEVANMSKILRFADQSARGALVEPVYWRITLENARADSVAKLAQDLVQAPYQHLAAAKKEAFALRFHAPARILVDHRTNGLIVMAMPYDVDKVEEVVALLDVSD